MSHFVPKATVIDLFGNYSDFSFKSVSGRIVLLSTNVADRDKGDNANKNRNYFVVAIVGIVVITAKS